MFCVHHDEERILSGDAVPCPFCGFGTPLERSYTVSAADETDDSHEALQHAMTLASGGDPETSVGPDDGLVNLRHYW